MLGLRKRPKIFVIGFNRCGTTALHVLFQKNGIAALHYHGPKRKFIIPQLLALNYSLGRPLLSGMNRWNAFSDLGLATQKLVFEGGRLFRELHAEYEDAYFILNTRPVEKWIASRLAHMDGRYTRNFAECAGVAEHKVAQLWRLQWDAHVDDVRKYFAGHNRFLEFDIECDQPDAVKSLLAADYDINVIHWRKRNATAISESGSATSTPLTGATDPITKTPAG